MMETVNVSTDQFWSKMCEVRAIRTGYRSLVVGNKQYVTGIPPEAMPHFIAGKLHEIAENLEIALGPKEKAPNAMRRIAAWWMTKRLLRRAKRK